MRESDQGLRTLFSEAGYAFLDLPIVYDANIFVELAGEDLRRRLFLTAAADGAELALRPDYTIPVCLRHLATGAAKRRADYAYLGPVFRQRQGESGEFLQAGVESLGRTDRAAADADILKLALAACDLLGVAAPQTRLGDSGLFAAILSALDLEEPWRGRLSRAFGDPARLRRLIDRAAAGGAAGSSAASPDKRAVKRKVEELLLSTGLASIEGRNATEIAERYLEKAALAEGIGPRAKKALDRFLGIAGRPAAALKDLRGLARREGLDIGGAIDRLETILASLSGHGIGEDRLAFAADFGRRLDYYTGFVFEIHDPRRGDGRQIVGGGRYDKLVGHLGDGKAVPAIGFAIWLDRIGGSAP